MTKLMNRREFSKKVNEFFTHKPAEKIMMAYDFAKAAHRSQFRDKIHNGEPVRYFDHPKEIAIMILSDFMNYDCNHYFDCVIIALLHDVPEDTALFGNQKTCGYYSAMQSAQTRIELIFEYPFIAQSVISLTKPLLCSEVKEFTDKKAINDYYKAKLGCANPRALLVKIYDQLHNCKSIEVKGKIGIEKKVIELENFYIPLFTHMLLSRNSENMTTFWEVYKERLNELKQVLEGLKRLI